MEVDLRVNGDVLVTLMGPIVLIYNMRTIIADLQFTQANGDIKLFGIFQRIDTVEALEHV